MQLQHVNQLQTQARDFVQELTVSFGARKKASTFALARVLAANFPMPSSQVDSIEDYYHTNVSRGVRGLLNSINEYLVRVDTDAVEKMTYMFYAAKYNCCFEVGLINMTSNSPVADFFGLSRNLSPDILQVIVEEHASINRNLRGWRYVMQDIRSLEQSGN